MTELLLAAAALGQPFLLVAVVAVFQRMLRNERRESANERRLLLNQILHLTGRPWQQAPADERDPEEDLSNEWGRYSASPEQLPVE